MYLANWLQQFLSQSLFSQVRQPRAAARIREHAWSRGKRRLEHLEARAVLVSDFGDAPDTTSGTGTGNYQTLLANGGPRHTIDSTQAKLFLGAQVDSEANAIPNSAATGDDRSPIAADDENGVVDPTHDLQFTIGASPVIRVRATNATQSEATLYGWIDYNQDGVFDNATERATVAIASGTDNAAFSIKFPAVPFNAPTGTTSVRLRLSSDPAAANPTGEAMGGEVEDYVATVNAPSSLRISDNYGAKIQSPPTERLSQNHDFFGTSFAALGDVDGDGINDLAVGAPQPEGSYDKGGVHIQFLNADGTVKRSVWIELEDDGEPFVNRSKFGAALSAVGDLDGDGITELAVGDQNDADEAGAVYILFLNTDGTLKNLSKITGNPPETQEPVPYRRFGVSLASPGDLDGDSVADLAVGQENTSLQIIFLNKDGTEKSRRDLTAGTNGMPEYVRFSSFGESLTAMGDMDGDGVTDLAAGGGAYKNGQGMVCILMLNSDGSVKRTVELTPGSMGRMRLERDEHFGTSLTNAGDLDGNGIQDLVVGSRSDLPGSLTSGTLYVLLMNADGIVKQNARLAPSYLGNSAFSAARGIGGSVAAIGDLNGDGVTELAIGDDSQPIQNRDVIYIVSLQPVPEVQLSGFTDSQATEATIVARLSHVSSSDTLIDLNFSGTATAGIDYSLVPTTIRIPAGDTWGSIRVPLLSDTSDEPVETIAVSLATLQGARDIDHQQLVIPIEDDDPSPISVTRNNGLLTIANVAGIATDIRIGVDIATSRVQIESLTDGAVASLFRSPLEGLRGLVVNLGPQSDRLNASSIVLPITVSGGTGDDTIVGGGWTDLLIGDAGADSIIAGGGRDTVSGGAGNDTLNGGASIDLLMEVGDVSFTLTSALLSGLGNDQLTGFEAANLTGGNSDNTIDASAAGFPVGINGGMGADTLLGSNFADTLNAGTGNDALFGYGGRDLLIGGVGNDVLDGGGGEDTLDGEAGTDTVRRKNDLNFTVTSSALLELMGDTVLSTDKLSGIEAALIMGGPSANRIDLSGFSGSAGTTIQGGGGNDTVIGSDASDFITTTDGNDNINARGGNDVVRSGAGADSIVGGGGNDLLDGGAGADAIAGEAGNDTAVGGEGNDLLSGGAGADVLAAVSGADLLSGGEGDDQLLGGDGAETLLGDDGNDRLFGAGGNDSLDGGAGADSLQGGVGTDTVLGGSGDDQLGGGANADSIDGGSGINRLNEIVDGNVVIVGTALTSESLGNEAPMNINRIILSGGAENDLFDARLATVSVQLQGNAGNDILLGGRRADSILGGDGNDVISGGGAIDLLSGGNGFDDWLEEADSNFAVTGITVTSAVTGSERVTDIERITLIGGTRANLINAASAGVPVILIGGQGNDTLIGGSLADTLSGGNRGDTTITGGDGTDSLDGGLGADVLEIDQTDRTTVSAGDTRIADAFTLLPSWIDAL